MDVLGYFLDHGFSGLNSLLLAILYLLIRNKLETIETRLNAVYEWHLIQKGIEQERTSTKEDA